MKKIKKRVNMTLNLEMEYVRNVLFLDGLLEDKKRLERNLVKPFFIVIQLLNVHFSIYEKYIYLRSNNFVCFLFSS
jgi:hypothetical protein